MTTKTLLPKREKIKSTAEDFADVLFFGFRYALGRETFAVELIVKLIIKNWAMFEKFETEAFVAEITRAVVDDKYGKIRQWLLWKKVLVLAKVSSQAIEIMEIKVLQNERKKNHV